MNETLNELYKTPSIVYYVMGVIGGACAYAVFIYTNPQKAAKDLFLSLVGGAILSLIIYAKLNPGVLEMIAYSIVSGFCGNGILQFISDKRMSALDTLWEFFKNKAGVKENDNKPVPPNSN